MKKRFAAVCLVLLISVSLLFSQGVAERQKERIGIISAMNSELSYLLDNAEISHVDTYGGVDFHVGTLCGKDVVLVKAGVGKILAASGTAALLNNYNISNIIFTGIAGGVGDETKVTDIVVSSDLVVHDYGTLGESFVWGPNKETLDGYIPADRELSQKAYNVAVSVVGEGNAFIGTIVTGDQFIASAWYVKELQDKFNALACEMEGAAVGLVAYTYGVPFVVIRSMSDKADGLAHETIKGWGQIAADNSAKIVMALLEKI